MHALLRKISPYTDADVLLGVFCSRDEADAVRKRYLEDLRSGRREDPWREQAYKSNSLAEEDLQVLDLTEKSSGSFEAGDRIFVVSAYSEGFGQIVREIRSLERSEKAATARVAQIEDERGDFCAYALLQELIVGQELSDSRESQPGL